VYDVWGLSLTEVEVDMLTGEYKVNPLKIKFGSILIHSGKIVRLDIIEDCGISLSPEIDLGQVEGSMMMGLGLWTTEKLQYDATTGELLTMNTWVSTVRTHVGPVRI
jgi:xanthine dehydrogenase molybdopterin-binding subunit B